MSIEYFEDFGGLFSTLTYYKLDMYYSDEKIIQLINNESNINQQTPTGYTILMAVLLHQWNIDKLKVIIETLFSKNVDIFLKNENGETAIDIAAKTISDCEILILLLLYAQKQYWQKVKI